MTTPSNRRTAVAQISKPLLKLLKGCPALYSGDRAPEAALSKLEALVEKLLRADSLAETTVTCDVLNWSEANAEEAGEWFLGYMKGEAEHQTVLDRMGRSTECLLVAIPVLFPRGAVFGKHLTDLSRLEWLRESVQAAGLVHRDAECWFSNSMLSHKELSSLTFGEMKRLSLELATQAAQGVEKLLQLPSWLYADRGEYGANWGALFNVDMRYVIGVVAAPADVLPVVFPAVSLGPGATDEQEQGLPPPGVYSNGMSWEQEAARQLAYMTVVGGTPFRVGEPLPIYSAIEASLELARQTALQMTIHDIEHQLSLCTDDLLVNVYPRSAFGDDVDTEVALHFVLSSSINTLVSTYRWPILPHEPSIASAYEMLLGALDMCGVSVGDTWGFGAPSANGLVRH